MNRILIAILAILAVTGGLIFLSATQNGDQKKNEPILAVVDYTDHRGTAAAADGVALVDLIPQSPTFGEIVQQYELGPGVIPHHPYYNRDKTKLYTTALAGERLYSIDIHGDRIAAITPVDTGDCVVGEDLYFSRDESRFYLTCLGSDNVKVFDATTDQLIDEIKSARPEAFIQYPHGIAVDEQLDRMIVTETVSDDLSVPGASVSVVEYSSGEVLQSIPVAKDPDTPGAPVEVVFHPRGKVAYLTGMLDASIWTLSWNDATGTFDPAMFDDGEPRGESWPLEPLFGPDGNLYVSWAQPGHVNVYNLDDPLNPRLIRRIDTEPGAHHVDFSPDGRYMFVQNNMINLEGMDSGTISVVDLNTGETLGVVDSFLELGLMPESMILLGGGGHSH